MNPQGVLDAARDAQRAHDAAREKQRKEQKRLTQELGSWAGENLFPSLRPASPEDYRRWLRGYIENGGKPTHVYGYPFSTWKWYVAIGDIKAPTALHGSQAIHMIIPAGINVAQGDWGHCSLFFMDGYRRASITVPIFGDTNFDD